MKYHNKINQARSGNTFGTKPCRDRQERYEIVTLYIIASFRGRWRRGFYTVSSWPNRWITDQKVFGTVSCCTRCGAVLMAFLQCGSVRFYEIGNLTVRFGCGFQILEVLRRGSVLWYIPRCGSVRFRCREPYGAVWLSHFIPYDSVRCGHPIS